VGVKDLNEKKFGRNLTKETCRFSATISTGRGNVSIRSTGGGCG
jgi:hypothetical protein